jgi:hypothetical protein
VLKAAVFDLRKSVAEAMMQLADGAVLDDGGAPPGKAAVVA